MKLSAALTFFNVSVVLYIVLQEMIKWEALAFFIVPVVIHVVLSEMRTCETLTFSMSLQYYA